SSAEFIRRLKVLEDPLQNRTSKRTAWQPRLAAGGPPASAQTPSRLSPTTTLPSGPRGRLKPARGKTAKGLSWQKDIGMVSELAYHTDNAPCFVFEDVPGTLPGSRVLINFFDGMRKNMTLGFPTDMSKVELSEGFRTHYAADLKRIPPKYVET